MKKTDDRGVSLVELLVAVCILAIITIPIMHSFVSSYRVNARSRQTMRATTLAQNEMEIFEREKLEHLVKEATAFGFTSVTEPNPADPDDPGCYTFEKLGIINDNSGRSMFDVYVTLDPERSGKYQTQNVDTTLLSMSTLSALDSGTYAQKVKTERNRKSDDDLVYETYETYAESNGHADKQAKYFKQKLERTITLDIWQEDDGTGEQITKAMVTYDYFCPDDSVQDSQKTQKPVETVIFNNAGSKDEEGNRVELKSLYLFYAPRYFNPAEEGYDPDNHDVIIVNNTANLPVEVYIIRQNLSEDAEGIPTDPVADYQAELHINDPGVVAMWDKCTGTYYTNLNLDSSAPPDENALVGRGKEVDLYFNGMSVMPSPEASTRTDDLRNMGCMKLGSAQAKDRIYTMLVEVYQAGDVYGTDKPIVTMNGTKLE